MEAASLDEVARGRVIVGVGRVLNALRKQGLEQAGTTQLVKESIDLIRGFLSGQLVQYSGTRFSIPPPGSRLGLEPSKDLPIYVGATGPAMLRLAGQYADGVLFNYPCTPGFIAYAMPFLEEGLRRSGRTIDNFDVAAYLLVAVDEDEKRALGAAKQFVAQMLRHAGVSEPEIILARDRLEKLGLAGAAAELDDALARKVTIAGTPDQVIEGLRQFRGSGLKLPIIWEIIGPNRRRSLSLIAKEVMPKLL
jgi:5,10-methylenetetrahydromethanopterin reductase